MKEKFNNWKKNNKEEIKMYIKLLFACLLLWFLIDSTIKYSEDEKIKEISYNEFVQLVKEDKVDTVYYSASNEEMTITLFNKETEKMGIKERKEYKYKPEDKRKTSYPAYETFRKEMLENDVNLVVKTEDALVTIFSALLTLAFPLLWIVLILRMMKNQGGLDKNTLIQESDVTFDDVIGQDEIIDDIRFITELIKDPSKGEDIGVKVPKGILFSGEPGTGKTLIAKAIAGEAGVPFLYMNASSFIEMFVGVGAKRVRDLFKLAKENTPCIVFIDEIDAVGQKRDGRSGSSESDQTINALLQEMDGFNGREGIFVIAATNRPDKLDKALTRAGRFDRQVVVNPPRDWKVRSELFNHYLKDFKLSDDIDITKLSKQVSGFTGADIAMVCNEAGIIAMMKEKDCVDTACIEEAIDKKIFKGNRSKEEHYKNDKKIVAYHEAGHAVMSYLLGEPIARASIIGTTSGVGGVVFREDSDSVFVTNKEIKEHILIAYAGRASEEIKFDSVSSGASSDITNATRLMLQYIEKYGFDKEFGLLDMSVLHEQSILESSEIVKRLSNMSKELYKECLDLLAKDYDKVELLVTRLLEIETMSGNEIMELFESSDDC